MKTKPDISIIIPVYNAGKWLSRCLDSIKKQTFGNFEVIMVNDASTDNSVEIATEYVRRDDRFLLINKNKNEGTMSARESGYQKAEGNYITFSDADDYLPENAFQILYDKITTDHSDIVFGGYTIAGKNHSLKKIREVPSGSSENDIQILLLRQKLPNTLWGNIYSSNLFKNYPLKAFKGLTNAEDRMLLIQLVSNAKKFSHTDDSTYYYYQNDQSNSRTKISERVLKNIIFSNDWCYRFLMNKGIRPRIIQAYQLYRTRYLLELGARISDIMAFTTLNNSIYSFTTARKQVNLPFAIHYSLLRNSRLYVYGYSALKNIYYRLSNRK